MQRVPLEQLCLQIKRLKLGSVEAFLNQALEPPPKAAVEAAMRALRDMAAVEGEEDDLTALGSHLSELPVDVRCARQKSYEPKQLSSSWFRFALCRPASIGRRVSL